MGTRRAENLLHTVFFWGSLWGVFEATAGYLLHLLPVQIGFCVWFPAAYFFMCRAYEATRQKRAVVLVALLSAAIKLMNLFTQIRPDYVVNPAVAIVLEALAVCCALLFALGREPNRSSLGGAKTIFLINTFWRLLYTGYVGFLIPAWFRDVSVVRNAGAYLSFIFFENILSTLVCAAGASLYRRLRRAAPRRGTSAAAGGPPYGVVGALFVGSLILQVVL